MDTQTEMHRYIIDWKVGKTIKVGDASRQEEFEV